MEIELTDDQAKKVEILKENGVDVGEAIDILFEMREEVIDSSDKFIDNKIAQAAKEKAELEEKISKIDEELSLFEKLKDTSIHPEQKLKIIEKEYGRPNKTYDESVHDAKLKFRWSKSIFKF